MITQCNTKLFFQFQILKFFVGKYCSEWKVIHCYCPESLSSPACAVSVASLHPPSAASPRLLFCLSPPSDLRSGHYWGKISVYWCKWGGHWWQPGSQQGSIRDLSLDTAWYLCFNTKMKFKSSSHHICPFVRWCKVRLFTVSSITSFKKEKSPV